MRIKRIFTALAMVFSVCGCDTQQNEVSPIQPVTVQSDNSELSSQDILGETEAFSNECFITLDSTVSINGSGAWIDNGCVTISESGVYTITGEMSDGMIYVETTDTVKLIFDNAQIVNKSGAAIIAAGGKLILEAAEGTQNSLKDGKDYDFSRSFENADLHRSAIHSDGELYLTGAGGITVNARYKDAVYAEKALYISDCTLDIEADKAGIGSGRLVTAENSKMTITSEGDCIKTESDSEGGITLNSCNLTLSTEKDGIQAGCALEINGGNISVNTSGDILADAELSSKGIKALNMTISQSSITVNSTDHSVKCDGEAVISGGKLVLSSSAGKGITADGALTIDADIDITNSEEGIESKGVLSINGGNINVTSTDDGLNTGGDDFLSDHTMNINGGMVTINAGGDGLDANGDINVTGGTVVVFGPENNANSSLDSGDFGYNINISGGKVLAMGSMGMMKQPSGECISSSDFSAAQGQEITVKDESGNTLISVTALKAVRGFVYCGENAESCRVYVDGAEVSVQAGMNAGFGGFGGTGGNRGNFGGRGGRNPDGMKEIPDGAGGTPPEMPEGGFGGMMPPDMAQGGQREQV